MAKSKIDITPVERIIRSLQRDASVIMMRAMVRAAQIIVREIRHSIKDWVSNTDGPKTGALWRSFKPVITQKDGEHTLTVGSDLVYARIHELGGVIKPIRGKKYLAVPLTPTARRVRPREFPSPLTFIMSRAGNPLLVEMKKTKRQRVGKVYKFGRTYRMKGAAFTPQYALKKSVRITPKGYVSDAAKSAEADVQAVIAKAVRQIMRGAK